MSCLTPSRHPDTPESTRNSSQQCQVGDLGGLASMSQSRYDEAIVDFNSAIKLDPDYATPYGHRGRAWSELSEYDKAIGDFSRAIALNELAETYMARGDAFSKKEEHRKALKDYDGSLILCTVFRSDPVQREDTTAAIALSQDLQQRDTGRCAQRKATQPMTASRSRTAHGCSHHRMSMRNRLLNWTPTRQYRLQLS